MQEIRFDMEIPDDATDVRWSYRVRGTRGVDSVRRFTRVGVTEEGQVRLYDGQVYGPADALTPELRSYALNRAADVLAGRARVVVRTVLQLEPVGDS